MNLFSFSHLLSVGGTFLLTFLGFSCEKTNRPLPPNLILIMADDLGYGGIGCYGNDTIQTPHLDRMAAGGLRFTDFHANGSVCSPTRAALLTGRYQQRAGMEGVIYARGKTRATGLDTTTYTLAEGLQSAGYATGIMGKWHLGYDPKYNPVEHGFDSFYGYVSGNVDFHSHYDNAGVYDWYHNQDSIYEEGYVTDLITAHAIDFITAHQDEPFFLYLPHEAPHVPFQGRNDPAYRFSDNTFTYYGPVKDRSRAYREMVEVMDEGIGAILDQLETLGLAENTLVVFISDNGAETFGHNGPLSGSKGSLLEGGHRVPAIAYWKGKIKPAVTDQTTMSFDWMPTFLSLAGAATPSATPMDGADLSTLLFDNKTLPERPLFWRYRQARTIRYGHWKLLLEEQDTFLYNLAADLGEQSNLAQLQPILVDSLVLRLQAWEAEMDQVPQKTR